MSALINSSRFSPDTGNTIALMKNEPIVARASYESLSRLLPHAKIKSRRSRFRRLTQALGYLRCVSGSAVVSFNRSSAKLDVVSSTPGCFSSESIMKEEKCCKSCTCT